MSQGTAINNKLRVRQQIPRQIDGKRNPFPNSGYVFIPIEQLEAEPQAGYRREGGSGAFVFGLFLVLAVVAGIYWLKGDSNPNVNAPSKAPATEMRRVDVSELNMREMPNLSSPVKFILPQGTPVEVMNEAQQFDGDAWVKVRVQTREGLQDGWVNARYIR